MKKLRSLILTQALLDVEGHLGSGVNAALEAAAQEANWKQSLAPFNRTYTPLEVLQGLVNISGTAKVVVMRHVWYGIKNAVAPNGNDTLANAIIKLYGSVDVQASLQITPYDALSGYSEVTATVVAGSATVPAFVSLAAELNATYTVNGASTATKQRYSMEKLVNRVYDVMGDNTALLYNKDLGTLEVVQFASAIPDFGDAICSPQNAVINLAQCLDLQSAGTADFAISLALEEAPASSGGAFGNV